MFAQICGNISMKETLLNGYEEIYQVSNAGSFKSVNRIGKDRRILKEKIKVKNGYIYMDLRLLSYRRMIQRKIIE